MGIEGLEQFVSALGKSKSFLVFAGGCYTLYEKKMEMILNSYCITSEAIIQEIIVRNVSLILFLEEKFVAINFSCSGHLLSYCF